MFPMIRHNHLLWQEITQASERIDNVQSPEELLEIVESMRKISPLQFDRRDYLLYFVADFTLLITGFYLYRETGEGLFLFLLMLALFIGTILAIRFYRREKLPQQLSKKIFQRDLLFDNQIVPIAPETLPIDQLLQQFREFNRGNYRRDIPDLLKGEVALEGHSHNQPTIDFYYFHFHYIDEEIIEEKDNAGKPKNRKVYHHYHRYGLLLDLTKLTKQLLPTLQISADRKLRSKRSDYLPASISFRKTFSLTTSEQHFAAKILTPTMVEQLLKIGKAFKNLNIELNQQLLIAFDNADIIAAEQNYDLTNIDDFILELKEKQTLPQLTAILTFTQNILNSLR